MTTQPHEPRKLSHYESHRPDYNRGLKCLTCDKPLQNRSKTDYCQKHLPRRICTGLYLVTCVSGETVKPGVQISHRQSDGTYMVLIWSLDENNERSELIAVAGSGLTHDEAEIRREEVIVELEEMAT